MGGFSLATRVRDKEDSREGTVCPDIMGSCDSSQTPVVWDGESSSEGTLTTTLTSLGPEGAEVDGGCGGGKGEDCCIFIVGTGEGVYCGRFKGDRWSIIMRVNKMTAQRQPNEPYPKCKLEE